MIAFLLFLILCVLLFGAGAVLNGLGWLALISVGLLVVGLVVFGSAAFVRSTHDEIAAQRREKRPWLFLLIAAPAVLANFALAVFWFFQGGKIDAVPYYWVPVTLIFASMVVLAMESANSWLPKVPAYVAGLCVGYAKFLVAPVLAPIGHWKSIRKPDLAGDRAGVFAASVSTLWTFIVAVILWWFVVLVPLIFVVFFIYDAVR